MFASWKDDNRRRPFPPPRAVDADSDSSFDSSDSAYDSESDMDVHGPLGRVHNDDDSGTDTASAWSGIDVASDGASSGGESSSEEDTSTRQPQNTSPSAAPRKKLGFKAWAMQQVAEKKPYVAPLPLSETDNPATIAAAITQSSNVTEPLPKKRKLDGLPPPMIGPLGETHSEPPSALAAQFLPSPSQYPATDKPTKKENVFVTRTSEVQEARLALPVVAEEQSIVEAILLNSVVVLCGETGSGKTTQVPQFLYEAGFGSPDSGE
jgi:ATP-dependent RNA helicase DHX37/DHR1